MVRAACLTCLLAGVLGCATGGSRWMTRSPAPAGDVPSSSAKISAEPLITDSARRNNPRLDATDTNADADADAGVVVARKLGVDERDVRLASAEQIDPLPPAPSMQGGDAEAPLADMASVPPAPDGDAVSLPQVIDSVYRSYPLLEAAIFGRNIAAGEQLAAQGAYDLKLKANSDNTPVGFYRTYRQGVGLEQDLYYGGQVFGGYRAGNGEFEPWYLERQTNNGGEFRAGFSLPLAQNRAIDERRAELWKATYGRNAVEPAIQSQLIGFVYGGSIAYWEWVAAGQTARYAQELYDLAVQRDAQLRPQVEQGAQPESILTDNQRLIVSRQVKLIDAQRKLQQTAVKLSLFLRTADGEPYIPAPQQLPPGFPEPLPVTLDEVESDVVEALNRRPELRELDFARRITEIDLAQAHNLTQPELDATLWGAQDVGGYTSSKGDKAPFELQGSVNFTMPLQRRKAQGKIWSNEGKIAQISAKRQFTEDKIATEVRNATISLSAAYQSIGQARQSVQLNVEMQQFETILLNNGASDLLRLNLREQQTFDARLTEVDALLRYFEAEAELRAAIGLDADGLSTGPVPGT